MFDDTIKELKKSKFVMIKYDFSNHMMLEFAHVPVTRKYTSSPKAHQKFRIFT